MLIQLVKGSMRHKNSADILSSISACWSAYSDFSDLLFSARSRYLFTTVGNYTDKKMLVKGFFNQF